MGDLNGEIGLEPKRTYERMYAVRASMVEHSGSIESLYIRGLRCYIWLVKNGGDDIDSQRLAYVIVSLTLSLSFTTTLI